MNTDSTPSGESSPTPSNEGLQFEKADFAGSPGVTCVLCKQPIAGEYYQVNGQTVCGNCRPKVDSIFTGGSKIGRMFKATGAGIVAGIGGFLVYWGVRAGTGYEIGLIAILVGWMVGVSVRWGAQRRGGLFYQLLAAALTYCSIASSYTPEILNGIRSGGGDPVEESATENRAGDNKKVTAPAAKNEERGAARAPFLFQLIIAFVISLAAPFLMGTENLIGWIIIAVGLWEAWRLNKRVAIDISGPMTASSPAI
jgi:hypothetical protein